MATPKKLICDMCGNELTDKSYIEAIFEGAEAWQDSRLSQGIIPRGFFPCENFRNCGGEMIAVKEKGFFHRGGNDQ